MILIDSIISMVLFGSAAYFFFVLNNQTPFQSWLPAFFAGCFLISLVVFIRVV